MVAKFIPTRREVQPDGAAGGVVAKPGIATGSRSNIRAVTRERNPWIKGSNGHEFFIPEHIPSAPPTLDVNA
jgi:hypothetical protein